MLQMQMLNNIIDKIWSTVVISNEMISNTWVFLLTD